MMRNEIMLEALLAKFQLLDEFQKNYSRIYEYLKRHRFDGVGFQNRDWPEILIFNPSDINPLTVPLWNHDKKENSDTLSQTELKQIQEVAEIE